MGGRISSRGVGRGQDIEQAMGVGGGQDIEQGGRISSRQWG